MDKTFHKIIFGNCRRMPEIPDDSVQLMVTSPPYFNAPFDYPELFSSYAQFLKLMKDLGREVVKKLEKGRIAAFVADDMLVDGEKYPIVADITNIMTKLGLRYRDRIVWKKPEGYIRISRRSGVLLQHPYPMYFYPDNIQESILIFQKGKFDYGKIKEMSAAVKEESKINIQRYQKEKWFLSVWEITNVLPTENRIEKGVAAFPEEIPKRLIELFTFKGETVLDPFLGSGTTTKVARELGRNSYGYEIDLELEEMIKRKINFGQTTLKEEEIKIERRRDARRLRKTLDERIERKESVTGKSLGKSHERGA